MPEETIAKMNESVNKLVELISGMNTLLQEDHKALRGNGHKGALDRLTDLENKFDNLDKRQTDITSMMSCMTDLKVDLKLLTSTVSGLTEQVKLVPQMLTDIEMLKNKRIWWRDLVVVAIAIISMLVSIYMAFRR